MSVSLQQLPTTFLMLALYENPTASSFSWNIAGQSTPVTRAQVVLELANRSGQGDSSQIVSAKSTPVATNSGSTTVNNKSALK